MCIVTIKTVVMCLNWNGELSKVTAYINWGVMILFSTSKVISI
jgi:hypothetical protein